MDIFIKGVSFPITLESLEKDLNDDVIQLIPNPSSRYCIYKDKDTITLSHRIIGSDVLFSVNLCKDITLYEVIVFLNSVLENRLFL